MDAPRRPCGCLANMHHTCSSGQRLHIAVNLSDDRWQAIAHERLEEAMAGVPRDLRSGYATLTFQWGATPTVWPPER